MFGFSNTFSSFVKYILFIYLTYWPEDVVCIQRNTSSFSFKNVVFYIQVLVNLIFVGNFGKVVFNL